MKHLAITGIPGSGKTTLAVALGRALDWQVIGSGDIARAVDPAGLAVGGMADEEAFRTGWRLMMAGAEPEADGVSLIFDGIPRSKGQLELLPPGTQVLLLTCRPDIAKQRLLFRGRSDDNEAIINRRVSEQAALLEVNNAAGWIWKEVGYRNAVNTDYKSAEQVLEGVYLYVTGAKREPY